MITVLYCFDCFERSSVFLLFIFALIRLCTEMKEKSFGASQSSISYYLISKYSLFLGVSLIGFDRICLDINVTFPMQ